MNGLLGALIFMAFMFGVLGVIIFLTFQYIKHLSAKTTSCWTAVADSLGLQFSRDPERKDPLISGVLDGVRVTVQQSFQSKRVYRAEQSHLQHLAGTIVESPVEGLPKYWVVPKGKKSSSAPEGMVEYSEGSGEFLKRYLVFLPEEAAEAPDEQIQEIMLRSTQPLALVGGKAVWWRSGIVREPEILESGVTACVTLAKEVGKTIG